MSLTIDEDRLGLGQAVEREVTDYWNTIDDVMIEVMKEGFKIMDMPAYGCPHLDPSILTNISPDKYAVITLQLESWQSYTESTMAAIRGGILECENEISDLEAAMRTGIRQEAKQTGEKKPAEDVIKDTVLCNPRRREVVHRHQMLKQKFELIESHYKKLGRELKILSRWIEMRKMEMTPPAGNPGQRRWP